MIKKISLDFNSYRIKEIQKIQKFEQRKYFKEQAEVLLGLGIETWNDTPAKFQKMLEKNENI